jgi:16S rRNA C967 or C1407 C5-methylase (RsmB/RsmF family)/NOL1/NOP2/fmu family ribosome biogenesis protein
MYPPEFVKRIFRQEYIDADGLMQAMNSPAPVSIRLNRNKWSRPPAGEDSVPWSESGYYLEKRPSFTLDPLFHSGCYYPQEASSMIIEEVYKQLKPKNEGIRILDLCAAPGGKSTHLSSLLGKHGVLISNEVIRSRASVLAENVTKWGLGNTIVTNNDPSSFIELKEYFDLILVDAPCSGEGMFSDPAVRNEWSADNASLCAERQKRILSDVWPALREGGCLIYCTCTFNPAENEENIKWLAEKTGSESLTFDLPVFADIQEIKYERITGYAFYPGRIRGEGFFCSVLKKPHGNNEQSSHFVKKIYNPLTTFEIRTAERLVDCDKGSLFCSDDTVYSLALPVEEYFFLKKSLRILKGGTALFKSRKDSFTPLHDLALSLLLRKDAFCSSELDYSQSVKFLRRDTIVLKSVPEDWIILTYMGINLGIGKNIGSRMNNYYPVEWRIRMSESSLKDINLIEWI